MKFKTVKAKQAVGFPRIKREDLKTGESVLVPEGFFPDGKSRPWTIQSVKTILGKFCRTESDSLAPIEGLRYADQEKQKVNYTEPKSAPKVKRHPRPTHKDLRTADRMDILASKMDSQIEEKMHPASADQTPTRRRMRIVEGMREDGERLQRVQKALRVLAALWRNDSVPMNLTRYTTKKAVGDLLSKYSTPNQGHTNMMVSLMKEFESASDCKEKQDRERKQSLQVMINKVRFQKIAGYFPTPEIIIDQMISEVGLDENDIVLEPSAGCGSIADQAKEITKKVKCVEISFSLIEILKAKGHDMEYEGDFLSYVPMQEKPTVILMNPPFEKGQDIDHVRHAFENCLASGGRMVSIMSAGINFKRDKKTTDFRIWIDSIQSNIFQLPEGSFKRSGTGANSIMVSIEKE